MTEAPWLSVVMPARNGARWIGRALGSILAQRADAAGIECILVDGSDDAATIACARAAAGPLDLRIHARPDLGSWQAKTNWGVTQARAAHVSALHVDDLWLPGRAAAVRRWIAADPSAALHLNPSRIIDAEDRALGTWRCPLPAGEAAPVPPELFLQRLLVQNFIAIPAPVMRRADYLAAGGFDEALWYTADWDLYLRLGAAGPVRYHEEVLTAFRIHGGSLTVTGSGAAAGFEAQMRTVLDRHAARLTPEARGRVLPAANASIAVNLALAAALHGDRRHLARAARALAGLGPLGLHRYLRDSRLAERLVPRLRARLGGRL